MRLLIVCRLFCCFRLFVSFVRLFVCLFVCSFVFACLFVGLCVCSSVSLFARWFCWFVCFVRFLFDFFSFSCFLSFCFICLFCWCAWQLQRGEQPVDGPRTVAAVRGERLRPYRHRPPGEHLQGEKTDSIKFRHETSQPPSRSALPSWGATAVPY